MSWVDGFRITGVINKNKKNDITAPEFKLDVDYTADYDMQGVNERLEYRISSEMNKIVLLLSNDSKELKIIANGKATVYNLVEKSTYDIMQDDLFEYDSFTGTAGIKSKYIDAIDEITIPDALTHVYLDLDCSAKSILIPDSVEYIRCGDSYSYSKFFKNAEKIVIDDSNPNYGSFNSNVIVDKTKMLLIATCQNSIIPEGVKIIGKSAFSGNTNLESIVIPNSVEVIEEDAFRNCSNLKNITFSSNLKRIGDSAFFGCKKLKEINLPKTLKIIDSLAFSECVSLENAVIPDSVEKIGNEAFRRCFNLERIILPENAEIADDIIGYGEGYTTEEFFGPTDIEEPHKYRIKCNFYNSSAYIGTKSNPYYMLIHVIKENYEELKVHKDIKMVLKDLHCKIVDKNGDKFIVKKTKAEEEAEEKEKYKYSSKFDDDDGPLPF